MNHVDRIHLLKEGVSAARVWAEFGSGTGAFTLALAELLGPAGEIYSVDKDQAALEAQKATLSARVPGVSVHYLHQDFTQPLKLPPLEGVVMANALHFVRDKQRVLQAVLGYLRPGGRFILVEYNINRSNPWVPYPLPVGAWQKLAERSGFVGTRLLATQPSRYHREIYAALSVRP